MSDLPARGSARWDDLPSYVLLLCALTAMGMAARGNGWELAGPLMAATALHPLLGRRLAWRGVPPDNAQGEPALAPAGPIGLGLFMIPFAGLTQVWEIEGRSGLGLNLPWHVSLFLLALGTWKLYSTWNHRRFGVVLFCGASAMATCGADVLGAHYLPLVVTFALAALVGLRLHMPQDAPRPKRPWIRWAAFAAAALLTGGLSIVGSIFVRGNVDKARQAFRKLTSAVDILPDSPGGFSDQAQLGDIAKGLRSSGGRTVALRARSPRAPGYLRGRGFLRYQDGGWTSTKDMLLLVGKYDPDGWRSLPGEEGSVVEGTEPDLVVHTTERYAAHMFLPLNTAAVETPGKLIDLLPANTIKATGFSSVKGYGVLLASGPMRHEPERVEWRALPTQIPELMAALEAKGKQLRLSKAQSPTRLVARIQEHFAEAYEYEIGIDFDEARDPLAQFLSEKAHGHCELFASAGTLLLRRYGVRARYVTGFVCHEQSAYDPELWIARNEHAHAWVEYYDPARGWQTAEFTPGSGQPPNMPPSGSEAFLDWLGGQWERLRGLFAREGLAGLLRGIGTFLKETLLWLVSAWWRVAAFVGVLAVYGFYRLLKGRVRARSKPTRIRTLSPELAAARKAYLALERRLTRQGHPRGDGETLVEFADRLADTELEDKAAAVAHVRTFAGLRYAQPCAARSPASPATDP